MKNRTKYLIVFSVYLLGFLLGALWYRYRIFPFRAISNAITIHRSKLVKYKKNIAIFNDRMYIDTAHDHRLESLHILQAPRHYKKTIVIETNQNIVVYRFIMSQQLQQFSSWKKTDIKLKVSGFSGTHDVVVKKTFTNKKIRLLNRSWIASPVLIPSTVIEKITFYFE